MMRLPHKVLSQDMVLHAPLQQQEIRHEEVVMVMT